MHCKNCDTELKGEFCYNCGQKIIDNQRLSSKEAIREFVTTTLLFDKKLLLTFSTLLTTPGKVGLAYINGQRNRYTRPLRFIIILLAFLTLTDLVLNASQMMEESTRFSFPYFSEEYTHSIAIWILRFSYHYSFISSLIQILISPLFFLFFFRKEDFTYIEILVLCFYYLAIGMLILYCFMMFFFYIFGIKVSLFILFSFFGIYVTWAFSQLYDKESKFIYLVKMILLISTLIGSRVIIILLISYVFPVPLDIHI